MIIEILIVLLAIPIGFLIAWNARDELKQGKEWFRVLMIASVIVGIWFYLTGDQYITWTSLFIFVTSLISLIKSEDKKWTSNPID